MTSCAYNYLYVQYKTRLITECTVHCPMAYNCFLTMDNWLCLVLPWLHLIFLGQVCDVVALGELPLLTLKAGCEQRLNHWCAEDKDKEKKNHQREEGLQRHTRKATCPFFLILSIKLHWYCLKKRQTGCLGKKNRSTNNQAGPGDSVRQQSSATALLWIQGEYWQWYHGYPIELKSLESHS